MAPEKIRREDVEACPSPPPPLSPHVVEFSRKSKKRRWKAGLLLATSLVVTSAISAAVGLVVGLGVVRSEDSSCSSAGPEPSVGGDATSEVSLHAEKPA